MSVVEELSVSSADVVLVSLHSSRTDADITEKPQTFSFVPENNNQSQIDYTRIQYSSAPESGLHEFRQYEKLTKCTLYTGIYMFIYYFNNACFSCTLRVLFVC